jgi:hypothetical protein
MLISTAAPGAKFFGQNQLLAPAEVSAGSRLNGCSKATGTPALKSTAPIASKRRAITEHTLNLISLVSPKAH